MPVCNAPKLQATRHHVSSSWRHHLSSEQPAPTGHAVGSASSELRPALPRWRKQADGTTFERTDVLCIEIIEAGIGGARPTSGDVLGIHYACLIAKSGCCVDASRSKMYSKREPYAVTIGQNQVVEGMERGLRALELGSLARLHVPPHLAYGEHSAGPIPPHAHLVFEVEILSIGQRRTSPRPSWLLRRLLMLPPPPDLVHAPAAPDAAAAAVAASATLAPGHPPPRVHVLCQRREWCAVAAAAAEADEAAFDASDRELLGADALAAPSPATLWTAEAEADEAEGDGGGGVLPAWLRRLHCTMPLPMPEVASYCAFERAMRPLLQPAASLSDRPPSGAPAAGEAPLAGGSDGGLGPNLEGDDLGPRLIPGASSIKHAPYGTAWDSLTPLVLTGDRAATGWPAAGWGWDFWERSAGEHQVICKARAPIFDDDQTADTLMAECTLREAMHYARTSHLSTAAEHGHAPILYMNGWDVFDALPHLWHEDIDKLPGTIESRTTSEYERLHRAFGLDRDGGASLVQKARVRVPHATCHVPRATCHAPRATCHAPRATYHAPHATCHTRARRRHATRRRSAGMAQARRT